MTDQAQEMVRPEPGLCGRATRSGRPCANRLDRGHVACRLHATDADRAVHDAYRKGWDEGWAAGQASGRSSAQLEQQHERNRAEREAQEAARFRERDHLGQLVVVDNGKLLTYRWTGHQDLEIGDEVVVPPNWLIREARACTVTALGSSYDGEVQNILRRAHTSTT